MRFIVFIVFTVSLFYISACSSGSLAKMDSNKNMDKMVVVEKYDKDYATMLAGSCLTCHKDDSGKGKIPSIHGKDKEILFTILKYFKTSDYDSGTMGKIAKTFSDEELELLSHYFADQK